jgi:hypothetical protein
VCADGVALVCFFDWYMAQELFGGRVCSTGIICLLGFEAHYDIDPYSP